MAVSARAQDKESFDSPRALAETAKFASERKTCSCRHSLQTKPAFGRLHMVFSHSLKRGERERERKKCTLQKDGGAAAATRKKDSQFVRAPPSPSALTARGGKRSKERKKKTVDRGCCGKRVIFLCRFVYL